jgi:hypothetical protein
MILILTDASTSDRPAAGSVGSDSDVSDSTERTLARRLAVHVQGRRLLANALEAASSPADDQHLRT